MPPEFRRRGADSAAAALVDREREVDEMRADLERALSCNGRVVLLGGEPGIGKTRLASALAEDAESRGVPVWWGRGWEDGSAPPFWPWNTALRGWIAGAEELVASAAGAWVAELAHVFPVLRDRLPGVQPSPSLESDRARFRLFDTVGRFLATIAAPAGLVIVLDDVHWADGPSLKLLEYIAADMRNIRLLVVATYRDTEVQPDDALFATLSRLTREPSVRRIFVTGLSAAHCAQWVAPFVGARADSAALGEALRRETNGNPFFLGEIVRLHASQGNWEAWDPRRVPQGVREVIVRRLERLGDACRGALDVAALLGDAFDVQTLREILDDDRVADRLQPAVQERILVEVEDQPGQFGFAHALIRRVLADELKPSVRATWHARIAAVLEGHAATSDVMASELVRHFVGAGTPAALHKAFDQACRGAERAARGLGWEEAVRLYEVALDVGGRCGAVDEARAIELRLARARALRGAGDVAAARVCCEEVMTACRRAQRPAPLARAALIHAGPLPEFGRVDPTGRAVLEEAWLRAAALDDGLRARLAARLAGDLIAANEIEQGGRVLTLCDEAARAARRAGDSGALAMALTGTYYAVALRMRSPAEDVRSRPVPSLQEILEAAEAAAEYDFAAAVRHLRAATLFAIGEGDGFSDEVDGLATMAAVSRAPEALWLADALAAMRATVQGRFSDAADLMDRAVSTGRRMQLPNAVGQHVSQRIMLHFTQGRLTEIAPEIVAFVEEHHGGRGWRPLRAIVNLRRGDAAAARAEFDTLLAAGLRPAERGVMSRCYLAGLALLCIELGDCEHAPMLYDRVARQREAWIIDGCQTLGPWALVQGALARLCGRPADAVRHYEHAIGLGQRMRSPPFVAQAQALLATVRLSMDLDAAERDRAAAMLAEAERRAHELGLAQVTACAADVEEKLSKRRSSDANLFRCDGDVWTVRYHGRELRLKDGKGPRYLATLLAAPGREFHVLQLAGAAPAPTARVDTTDGLSIGGLGESLDDAPDARARREYRARLQELQEELDEAERFADRGRAERLREELDILTTQLSERFGSRAHLRGPAETARKAVTKVLRTQVGKLLDAHPLLGQHLRDSLRMGTVCIYAPAVPTTWDVAFS